MNIAIIPARGGSKRIPRKNIKLFFGKPMIAWSIEAAKASGCFDRIVVSTDDDEIADIAKRYGAEVPFMRPAELSNDFAGTTPVVKHAIETLLAQGGALNDVCCIYATAPFVTAEDIRQAFEKLVANNCNYVFSATSFPFPIQRALKVSERGYVEMFQPENFAKRSQDLEECFHDAGQFYWGTVKAWVDESLIFGHNSMAHILPRYRVQDIDTPEDWLRAEMLFKALEK